MNDVTHLTWKTRFGGGQQNFCFWVTFEWLFFWCKILNFFEICSKSFILDRFWVIFKNHSNFITLNLTSIITQNRLFGSGYLTKNHSFWVDLEWFSRITQNSLLWIWRQKSLQIDYFEGYTLRKSAHFGSILSDFQESLRLHYFEFDVKNHSKSIILKEFT